jgi:peptidoglycan/LPS O-acetylase OafA/YrhL
MGLVIGARRPELDGLRGVAILLVVFAHATLGVWPHYRGLVPEMGSDGGMAGVQLFFVLSGYLITGVIVRGGGLGRFYRRRCRRLFPTLLVVVAVTVMWTGDTAGAFRALTYTENLPILPTGRWTDPNGWALSHTWSLAVEEQFYLVWPVALLIARRHAAKVAAVGIAVTWWLQQTVDWSDYAVYVGLRWDAVLAGCLLALVPWRASAGWFAAGAVVLGAYTLGVVDVGRGDFMVLTVASVALIAGAGNVGALRARWLVHVGRISYALYLWHVVTMRLDVPMVAALALGWGAAELTYLLVDRRAQRTSPPRPLTTASLWHRCPPKPSAEPSIRWRTG